MSRSLRIITAKNYLELVIEMYKPEKLLTGAPNARDLGGIETADGRRIKPNRLIRSGMLARLTDEDVEYLKSVGLKTVVDFRTSAERVQKPDRQIDNVEYIVCPMLEDKTEGITRDKPESGDEEAQRTLKMAHRLMATDPDGVRQMRSLYPILVTLEHSIEHYRKFFEILLNHEDGALLYHCTMGKDRVGTATALLLTALGVPREGIVADYMITRERCAPGTQRLLKNCRKFTDDEAVLEFVYRLDTVQEDFIAATFETIDEVHGGMDRFLREKMGLDETAIDRLKLLYLE